MLLPFDMGNQVVQSPPPGVVSNFENPESLTLQSHITAGILTVLLLLTVGLRAYCKIIITRNWGLDDCKCLIGCRRCNG